MVVLGGGRFLVSKVALYDRLGRSCTAHVKTHAVYKTDTALCNQVGKYTSSELRLS